MSLVVPMSDLPATAAWAMATALAIGHSPSDERGTPNAGRRGIGHHGPQSVLVRRAASHS